MANFSLQTVKNRFGIIGQSPLLDRALGTAVRVAPTELTVLVVGESGVGKEVFSRIIHELSPRKHNKFIAINCGAIPSGTINSELFGHEKGAFTGADRDRKGYFETVDGGTIFLDEIGEMPLDTQAYLLRVLESGEFIRVGSSKTLKTDVRVIAATNVDLEGAMRKGKFREDLYYRLSTLPIHVPSLQERPEDIPFLFRKFARDFAEKNRVEPVRLDDRAEVILQHYRWPGNIRELRNLAERLSILSEERLIEGTTLMEEMPYLLQRNLPATTDANGGSSFQEREILYKLLFDMKNDLNDLKGLVHGLIQNNNLNVPNVHEVKQLAASILPQYDSNTAFAGNADAPGYYPPANGNGYDDPSRPVIRFADDPPAYQEAETVEESLNLEDMERDMIKRALKKHNNRRKDAAADLGISERTLYRKIKEYQL